MVMHLVIPPSPPREDPTDDPYHPVAWPPDDPDYDVLADQRVSKQIKVWALLHMGPARATEMQEILGLPSPKSVRDAVYLLRKQGQGIRRKGQLYHLEVSTTLSVMDLHRNGIILAPRIDGIQYGRLLFRVKCEVRGGRVYLRALDAPPLREQPIPPLHEPWRPTHGPAHGAAYLGEPRRSLPVWAWGLLKTRAWMMDELAKELGVSAGHLCNLLWYLRRRGHRIISDTCGRHYIPPNDPPLRVALVSGKLQLAHTSGCMRRFEMELH